MKFFVDTANITEIRELQDAGIIDGVTTNPSLVLKANRAIKDLLREICEVTDGPVSGEVASIEFDDMMREGKILAGIAPNIVIKLPLTLSGLKACKRFSEQGLKTNVTLCFTANQALLAAKAGATYVSPFVGRLDDMNIDGMELIADIRHIYNNYGFYNPDFSGICSHWKSYTRGSPDRSRCRDRSCSDPDGSCQTSTDGQRPRQFCSRLENYWSDDRIENKWAAATIAR